MLDEPGCVMEPTDDAANGDAGVMVAFGMCGPLVVEEFDEERGSSENEEAGQETFGGWRFWRRR